MDCSVPGFPVFHFPLEFAQIHVLWVSDAIQPSHPLLPPSPSALNLFLSSRSFPMSWLFTSDVQSIRASASASVVPIDIQGWFSLGLTGLILSSTSCYFSWRCTWSLVISMAQNEIHKLCQAGGHRAIGCSLLHYSSWVESILFSFFKENFMFILECRQLIVSGGQQRDSAIQIHVSIFPQTPLPSRMPHNVEQSSPCHTVVHCWLSI